MKEIVGNLWDYYDHDHILVITTNGTVKRDGSVVMGRGCALEAKTRIKGIDKYLGKMVENFGNHVHILTDKPLPVVVAFPVKHEWWERADIKLIERSAHELVELWHNGWTHKEVVLPRPGCGNGGLKWETVAPLLQTILPEEFVVVTFR